MQVATARLIGASGFGYFAVGLAWINVLVVLATGGQETAALRYIPEALAAGESGQLRAFLKRSGSVVLIASAAVVITLIAAVVALPLDGPETRTLLAAACCVPGFALLHYAAAGLRAFRRILLSQFGLQLGLPVLFTGILYAFNLFSFSLSSTDALVVLGVVAAVLGTTWLGLLRSRLPSAVNALSLPGAPSTWAKTSRDMALIAFLQMTTGRIGILILGFLGVGAAAGYYAASLRLSLTIGFALSAVSAWVVPSFAAARATEAVNDLQPLLLASSRVLLLLSVPIALTLVFLGRPVLTLFGSGFEQAYPTLLILILGQLAAALTGPVGFLLTMTGNHSLALAIEALTFLLALALTYYLTIAHGIAGTAVATSIALVLRNSFMAVVAHRKLRLRCLPL